MEDNIRKEVKKVLDEEMGVQIDIDEMSKVYGSEIYNKIKMGWEGISDGKFYSLSSDYKLNDEQSGALNISEVNISATFNNSKENKIGGKLKSSKIVLQDDSRYKVFIDIFIKINNITKLTKVEISSVISHEFNHALVEVKNLSGERKAYKLNLANKLIKMSDGFKSSSELKGFSEMIYLSNPLEIQARVQETKIQIDSYESINPEDLLSYLLKFQPLNDARRLISYSIDDVISIDPVILKNYVTSFNSNIVGGSNKIVDVEKFFSYWSKVINKSGDKLAKKIYKLAANKSNLSEGVLYEIESSNSFKWVFGREF